MKLEFYIFFVFLVFFGVRVLDNIRNNADKDFVINTIVRGCARWASASLQDKSPLVAVLHANYAAGYLWALRDVFSDKDIQRSANVDIIKFQKRITDVQDKATKLMVSVCPKYRTDIDEYLGRIGGE
jgi:hypothetical protein